MVSVGPRVTETGALPRPAPLGIQRDPPFCGLSIIEAC